MKKGTLLHSAAKAANVSRVRELIQQGADVNLQNKVGDTHPVPGFLPEYHIRFYIL
ncbi:MAG TPA: ankyrin repeat domain-containing protein [Gammaproteobacteria bacterium]|jgi:hypothetical protein|nr:ankyrin repeat domain-containing protein [Gammaproteobacteria bacterium]